MNININSDIDFTLIEGSLKQNKLINFFNKLNKNKIKNRSFLMDNASIHKSKKMIKYIKDNNLKVIFFYDSFMTFGIHLYLNLFKEIYFIKNIFDPNYINIIKPDYIFELRVERFLF